MQYSSATLTRFPAIKWQAAMAERAESSATSSWYRKYDVALSFAGQDRAYVEKVAADLKSRGIRVFYDAYEQAALWGKNLYTHLRDVYQNQAKFTVLFISHAYAGKVWTNHEIESAQARAFAENSEYVLPARFDNAEVPGLLRTTGYIDLSRTAEPELCDLIVEKLRQYDRVHGQTVRHIRLKKDDECPNSMAMFRLMGGDFAIAVDPTRYSTFNELLDEIFIEYLSDRVRPFTYGSKWIIAQSYPKGVILAPPSWVANEFGAIHEFDLDWLTTSVPSQLGLLPGSNWIIKTATSDSERLPVGRPLVLACMTTEAFELAINQPKALYLLKETGVFQQADVSTLEIRQYPIVKVVEASFVRCDTGALVQVTRELPEIFKSFRKSFR